MSGDPVGTGRYIQVYTTYTVNVGETVNTFLCVEFLPWTAPTRILAQVPQAGGRGSPTFHGESGSVIAGACLDWGRFVSFCQSPCLCAVSGCRGTRIVFPLRLSSSFALYSTEGSREGLHNVAASRFDSVFPCLSPGQPFPTAAIFTTFHKVPRSAPKARHSFSGSANRCAPVDLAASALLTKHLKYHPHLEGRKWIPPNCSD